MRTSAIVRAELSKDAKECLYKPTSAYIAVLSVTSLSSTSLATVLLALYDAITMETKKPTILVVDDEPEIRKLVSAMLTPKGYNVIVADTGEQAIKLFRKQARDVDLLLTDVVAPGMAGPTLAD